MITLSDITVYPVKACRGIGLEQAALTTSGVQWDRTWMFVDGAGTFVSQRTHPRLARIETRFTDTGVELRAPELPPFVLRFVEAGTPVPVRIWKDACEALDQGDAAASWASEAAGATVRIVRAGRVTERHANAQWAGEAFAPIAFPDGYPVLVCNRASLAELNARMPTPIPMTRFRPNLVIDGLEAFAEDAIDMLVIGDVILRLVKPCTRCVVTSTDQVTGARDTETNPLPVLRQFRFDRELLGVTFGENAVVQQSGVVRRGVSVQIA
jgi:uncharacterized protein